MLFRAGLAHSRSVSIIVPFAAALAIAFFGCGTGAASASGLVVMSYNLQTLFDPVDQGGEYEEFRVSTGAWSDGLYRKRLSALASAILASGFAGDSDGPDVLVVQEAENARVLSDLAEAVGGYPYIVSSPDEDAGLACGVLSRLKPISAMAHRVMAPVGGPPSVPRYMLEVELDADGRRLIVIAAHLKSKLGGAEETEPERRAAAAFARALVTRRLSADPTLAVIIAGDFNENPDELDRVGAAYQTAMMPAGSGDGAWLLISGDRASIDASARPVVMYCPWDEAGGYSYRFQGEAERIDQLLISPSLVSGGGCPLKFEEFSASPPEFAVDASGAPIRWSQDAGSGYSDHVPIRARLSFSP